MERLAVIVFYICLAIANGKSATCPDPRQPQNGVVVCSKGNKHMSTCKIECNSGYVLEGPSIKLCWCKGIQCAWRGIESTCKETNCDVPTFDSGNLIIVEQWPGGFAALINLVDIPTRTELDAGWTVAIVFDKPLGKNVSVSNWNLQLSATSFEGQTLTLINQRHHGSLQITGGQYNSLVIINNVKSVIPTSAYIAMFDRRIEDVSCLTAPNMKKIMKIESVDGTKILTGPLTIVSSIPATPSSYSPSTKMTSTAVTTVTSARTSTNNDRTTAAATTATQSTTTKTESYYTTGTTVPIVVQQTSTETPSGQYCRLQTEYGHYKAEKTWQDRGMNFFSAVAALSITEELEDWSAVFVFGHPVTKIDVWACRVADESEDGLIWTFKPNTWVTKTEAGIFDIRFIATQKYQTVSIPEAQIYLCSSKFTSGDAIMTDPEEDDEKEISTTKDMPLHTLKPFPTTTVVISTIPPTARCLKSSPSGVPVVRAGQTQLNYKPNNDGTKYNYNELLHKSLLFYEAQRSGPLPKNQRVPWRGDSGLKDGCDIGLDMTGGWYDAGDTVKFGFPMAFSLTTLSWGAIAFREAYEDAGELEHMINCVKWPTEYFIKAHVSKYELVGQVGHGQTDHDNWERPEMMTTERPTYMITKEKPGTELAAETAAGLAAASIFLNKTHPELAQTALQHASELFEFADKYRGQYHKSILDASRYYKSYSGYNDELLWGAVWLYKATNDKTYLNFATDMYEKISGKHTIGKEFSWDQKIVGVQILLAQLLGRDIYRKPALKYIENVMRAKKTPQGMHFFLKWGSNRYAANAALMAIFGSTLNPPPQRKNVYLKWAQKQIGLLLGDTGRSYVVGFGEDYPKKPHHKASSCSSYPSTCGWNQYNSLANNPYILYGALVGGPNIKGVYQDNRAVYEESEVACDYNAGFQSAIAGLKHLAMQTRIQLQQSPMPVENITITTTSTARMPTTTTITKTRKPVKPTKKVILQKKRKQGKTCRPKRSKKCKAAKKKKSASPSNV